MAESSWSLGRALRGMFVKPTIDETTWDDLETALLTADFGPDMRTGQAEMNRPWFIKALGTDWFPKVAALHSKLQKVDVRVADIGCGEGWSSIGIALAYPGLTVDGYDVDEASMVAAREHAAAHTAAQTRRHQCRACVPAQVDHLDHVAHAGRAHHTSRQLMLGFFKLVQIAQDPGIAAVAQQRFTVDGDARCSKQSRKLAGNGMVRGGCRPV